MTDVKHALLSAKRLVTEINGIKVAEINDRPLPKTVANRHEFYAYKTSKPVD